MTDVVFVTGNSHKAKYFSKLVGVEIDHHATDAVEIQSLDLVEIASHKAKEAFKQLKRPVLVEDASLSIAATGKLPGPFIKWFIEEIGLESICRLADTDKNRSATASDVFVYYDGQTLKHFGGSLNGSIAQRPRGEGGYDWDKIFIPHYSEQTTAEMDSENYEKAHLQIKPIEQVKEFLAQLDKR